MHQSNPLYPHPDVLERRAQVLAMLDAILSPDWEQRYFSFNAAWSEDSRMASARDGSGNESFMLLKGSSCVFKQFIHEVSPQLSTEEVLEVVHSITPEPPALLDEFVSEPAFSIADMTELGWFQLEDKSWFVVKSLQLSEEGFLFSLLFRGSEDDYIDWVNEYFEVSLPEDEVKQIFQFTALTPTLVAALNPDADWETVLDDAGEIGYPVASR